MYTTGWQKGVAAALVVGWLGFVCWKYIKSKASEPSENEKDDSSCESSEKKCAEQDENTRADSDEESGLESESNSGAEGQVKSDSEIGAQSDGEIEAKTGVEGPAKNSAETSEPEEVSSNQEKTEKEADGSNFVKTDTNLEEQKSVQQDTADDTASDNAIIEEIRPDTVGKEKPVTDNNDEGNHAANNLASDEKTDKQEAKANQPELISKDEDTGAELSSESAVEESTDTATSDPPTETEPETFKEVVAQEVLPESEPIESDTEENAPENMSQNLLQTKDVDVESKSDADPISENQETLEDVTKSDKEAESQEETNKEETNKEEIKKATTAEQYDKTLITVSDVDIGAKFDEQNSNSWKLTEDDYDNSEAGAEFRMANKPMNDLMQGVFGNELTSDNIVNISQDISNVKPKKDQEHTQHTSLRTDLGHTSEEMPILLEANEALFLETDDMFVDNNAANIPFPIMTNDSSNDLFDFGEDIFSTKFDQTEKRLDDDTENDEDILSDLLMSAQLKDNADMEHLLNSMQVDTADILNSMQVDTADILNSMQVDNVDDIKLSLDGIHNPVVSQEDFDFRDDTFLHKLNRTELSPSKDKRGAEDVVSDLLIPAETPEPNKDGLETDDDNFLEIATSNDAFVDAKSNPEVDQERLKDEL